MGYSPVHLLIIPPSCWFICFFDCWCWLILSYLGMVVWFYHILVWLLYPCLIVWWLMGGVSKHVRSGKCPYTTTSVNCGAALPSRSAARRTCAYWCVSWMLTSTPVHARASWWTMEILQEADFWPVGIANDLWTPRNWLQWLPRKNAEKSFPNIPRRRWRSSAPPSTLRVASWIFKGCVGVSTKPTPTQKLGSSTLRLADRAFLTSDGRWTSDSILHHTSSWSYSVEQNISDCLCFEWWRGHSILKLEMSVKCPWVSF